MDAWAVTSFRIDDEIVLRQFTTDDAEIVFDAVRRNVEHLMEHMYWMVPDYYPVEMSAHFTKVANESRDKRESLGFGIFRGDKVARSDRFRVI